MEIKNIAAALLKVQSEIKNPANTARNPFFKSRYAPLPEILNQVRPLLTKNELILIQNTGSDEAGEIYVQTKLIHVSGEIIETDKLILKPDKRKDKKTGEEKATVQTVGSAITYGRRYQLTALLGISSEDDDDGNAASSSQPAKPEIAPETEEEKAARTENDDPYARRLIGCIKTYLTNAKGISEKDINDVATRKEATVWRKKEYLTKEDHQRVFDQIKRKSQSET